jgi:hypothetical protein
MPKDFKRDNRTDKFLNNIERLIPNASSGQFVFEKVRLSPGSNDFVFTAKDRAGNVSGATAYGLSYSTGGLVVKVALEKGEYRPNEEVRITSTVRNGASAETYSDLKVRVSIAGEGGGVLYAEEVQTGTLRPGEAFELETRWNTGSNRPGHYTVTLQVLRGASLLASTTVGFEIAVAPHCDGHPRRERMGPHHPDRTPGTRSIVPSREEEGHSLGEMIRALFGAVSNPSGGPLLFPARGDPCPPLHPRAGKSSVRSPS